MLHFAMLVKERCMKERIESEKESGKETSPEGTEFPSARGTEYSPLAEGKTRQVGINEPSSSEPPKDKADDFSGL